MYGKASTKESKTTPVIDGILRVQTSHWEKIRRILSIRRNKAIDDKEVMFYILDQGNLQKANCHYGVLFDVNTENVILEV